MNTITVAPVESRTRRAGLTVVAVCTAVALAVNSAAPAASSLVVAVLLGAVFGNTRYAGAATQPGLTYASRRLLRMGVVLLGLRLSLGDVQDLGWIPVLVVATTVTCTFFGTQWLGTRLGLSRDLSLLVATGYSICGASAIAAVEGSTEASEEETAAAMGLVAVAGTAAIFVLPILGSALGLSDAQFGSWAGASIHDVGQVVAATSFSEAALGSAVVVKLTRVALLAPVVAGVNISRRQDGYNSPSKAPLLPLFVVGFLGAIVVRTSGLMPTSALGAAKLTESILLTAAMVGLGSAVRVAKVRKLGAAPLLLGLLAWLLVGGVSLIGVLATT